MGATRKSAGITAGAAGLVLALGASAARADERDDVIRELKARLDQQAAEQSKMRSELDALKGDRGADMGGGRDALRAAVADLLREEPEIAGGTWIGPSGVARPKAKLDLGGYFSTIYRNLEQDDRFGSFVDNRLVLFVKSDITRKIDFSSEIEFEHGGVGGEVDGEVIVEFAQLRFRESECFAFKAGTLLVPFGRFNLEHDDPLNELSSRPGVSRFVNGVTFSLPGVGIEGNLPTGDAVAVNYDLVLTNGLKDEITSGDGMRGARGLFEDDDNHGKTAFGRVGVIPNVEFIDALSLGASGAWGNVGDRGRGQHDLHGYGVDLAAKEGPWEFKGEWSHLGIDRAGDAGPPGTSASPGPVRGLTGWYAQALHRFRGDWVRAMPFADESASVAIVLRHDSVDLNDRLRGASSGDDERAWTIGLNYRPTTKTVIKLEFRKAESGADGEDGEDRDLVALEFATYF